MKVSTNSSHFLQKGFTHILILPILLAILAGAYWYYSSRPKPPCCTTPAIHMSEQVIRSNTQAQFGNDLRVGSGNFWEEEYTDVKGKKVKGITAGLWIYPKASLKEHTERVFKGQELDVENFHIVVLDIQGDREKGSVKLKVIKK